MLKSDYGNLAAEAHDAHLWNRLRRTEREGIGWRGWWFEPAAAAADRPREGSRTDILRGVELQKNSV